MSDEHALDGLQAGAPARLKALEHAGAQQPGELGLDGQLVGGLQVKGAGPVPGHGQRVDRGGDAVQQPGMGGVEVVAARGQPRLWEAHGGAVGELLAGVLGLDEGAVAADADRVGEREEHVGVQPFGVALVRAGGEEQVAHRVDAARRECLVVAGEQHHEVVEVPQPVVDRRGREQHRLLARAAEQAFHRAIPGGVLVAQRVGLVDDHEAVGVLGVVQDAAAVGRLGHELLVGGQLVEGDDLGGQLGLDDALGPALGELRRGDDERVDAVLAGALLDERQADLGLAGADAVGVDDAAVAATDRAGALVAVALKRRELQPCRARGAIGLIQRRLLEVEQRAQVDRVRVEQPGIGEQQLAQVVLVVDGALPEPVEPLKRLVGHRGLVVGDPQLEVAVQAGAGEVGRGDERHAGVGLVAEQVGLAVQELLQEPSHLNLGPVEPFADRREALGRPRGREARQVALLAQPFAMRREDAERRLGAEPGRRLRADQQAGRAPVGHRRQQLQAAEIDVARGDRQGVPVVDVGDEEREGVGVAPLVAQVVEDVRAGVHATYASSAKRARTRSR